MSGTPELECFMNEEMSDVLFIIEGQRIPALKSFLSVKSRVFRAMFSGDFKESKDKEIVIEDTTYEAFKAFIRFLYNEDLVLKRNDFKTIRELYRLSDRYDVSRLEERMTDLLSSYNNLFPVYWFADVSDKNFESWWTTNRSIARIAFELKITKLMDKVMTFIDQNFDHFLKKDYKELRELYDLTDGRLLDLMTIKCRSGKKAAEELNALKKVQKKV